MPLGPWASFDAAEAELAPWCRDTTLCGGGWGVSRRDLRLPNTQRGTQRVLACHMRSKQCPWRLTLEESTAGWVARSLNAEHKNHDLTQSLAESNSYAGMRDIPSQFHDLMLMLAAAGQSPGNICKVVAAAADRAKIPVTWNYHDVYTFVSATAAEKAFDATGLLELLEERQKLHGLPYHYSTDADGRLSRVFAVLVGGLEDYAKCFSLDADGVQVNEAAAQYDVTVRYRRACRGLRHTWRRRCAGCAAHARVWRAWAGHARHYASMGAHGRGPQRAARAASGSASDAPAQHDATRSRGASC